MAEPNTDPKRRSSSFDRARYTLDSLRRFSVFASAEVAVWGTGGVWRSCGRVKMQVGEERNPAKAGGEEKVSEEADEVHQGSVAERYLMSTGIPNKQ